MDSDRSLSLIVDTDQWLRCAHDNTALLDGGGVTLTWAEEPERPRDCVTTDLPAPQQDPECSRVARAGGLAFDRWCRAYISRPQRGRVDVATWPAGDSAISPCSGGLRHPTGLAVDRHQRLYIVEAGADAVDVVDLVAHRLLRKVALCGHPVDVAAVCGRALVLLRQPHGLVWIDGRRGPVTGPSLEKPCGYGPLTARRVTSGPLVLWRRPGGEYAVIACSDGDVLFEFAAATDLAIDSSGLLVIAQRPGEPFRRYRQSGAGWIELEPVAALRYDGGGIAFSPDGRITYTATDGIRWTGPSTAKHITDGSVVTYRLDSGQYRTMWGRVFIDACIPPNTSVTLRFLTADDDDDILDPIDAAGPDRGGRPVPQSEATPPLPSRLRLSAAAGPYRLYRRPTGRERAWDQIAADDPFETYEAPVNAPPGRYLWLHMCLHGTAQVSPRVRAVRVERPGHHLLKTLPKSWSRQDVAASFIHRYLAPAEGVLHQLDQQSALRAILVDPHTTPQEALAWLASFAGLVLDRRWPEDARRQLVAEAYTLFRRRGTKDSLLRILEIYLGRPPVIVETWQLRGLGGTVLGTAPGGPPPPHVRASLRATGTLGRFTIGGREPGEDSYHLAAHRFTVLIPTTLNAEQRAVVNHILDVHRPAHTMGGICELGNGMRVGTQIRVAITTFVGPPSWFAPAIVGHSNIGEDGVVGTPAVGSRIGDGIAGPVRVG
jgi:phage tail-like protein